MTREQAGRPGVTWEHHLVHNEQLLDTRSPDGNQPAPPQPNRATRRALARANRQKGRRR
jgi:hypothetical protein